MLVGPARKYSPLALAILALTTVMVDCSPQERERCSPAEMAKCTDPLTLVTDNSDLGWGSSRHELDQMCPKLMDGLSCINKFTVRCLNNEQRSYFNVMYSGTIQVIEDLCREGPYQAAYLSHAPCMTTVQEEYQKCSKSYQEKLHKIQTSDSVSLETTDNDVGILCCSFQEYLDCSMSAVNSTCGRDTAVFTKQFLDRMASPLNQGHCQSFRATSQQCQEVSLSLSSSTPALPSLISSSSSMARIRLLMVIIIISLILKVF